MVSPPVPAPTTTTSASRIRAANPDGARRASAATTTRSQRRRDGRDQRLLAEKVSQRPGSPVSYPARNQRWRDSAEPCVQLSGSTRPAERCWMRSSPTAAAASSPSAMSGRSELVHEARLHGVCRPHARVAVSLELEAHRPGPPRHFGRRQPSCRCRGGAERGGRTRARSRRPPQRGPRGRRTESATPHRRTDRCRPSRRGAVEGPDRRGGRAAPRRGLGAEEAGRCDGVPPHVIAPVGLHGVDDRHDAAVPRAGSHRSLSGSSSTARSASCPSPSPRCPASRDPTHRRRSR